MKTAFVQQEMDRCGAEGKPFLFGVDFEMENGFLVENPLQQQEIAFACGGISNVPKTELRVSPPHLEILLKEEEAYRQKFALVRHGLMRGDSFLLNLTVSTPIRTDLSLKEIFLYSQAPYRLFLPGQLVCFSPESFVRMQGNEISTYPMKGTIDAALPNAAEKLLANDKELCEHYTIVDLLRNDLNRVATRIRVKNFRYIEKIRTCRGEILQTSSEITGRLPSRWQSQLGTLLFKLLPAGSVSGAPKSATLRLIRQAECLPRGYYSGVFGYFDGQSLDSAVMIRFVEEKNGCLYFRSGGGITVNSRPQEEYQEILEKIYLPL